MESQNKKQLILQKLMPWTGFFPVISCWVVVLFFVGDKKIDTQAAYVFLGLAVASIIMLLLSRRHFRKTESKMWLQNPAVASLKWMGMNILFGYLLLAVPSCIYGLAMGDFRAALAAFIYMFFSVIPAFPGIALGFYVHAHALTYKDGFSYRKLLCCRAI